MKRNECYSPAQMATQELTFQLTLWISDWQMLEKHHPEIRKDPTYIERKKLLVTATGRLRKYYRLFSELPDSEEVIS